MGAEARTTLNVPAPNAGCAGQGAAPGAVCCANNPVVEYTHAETIDGSVRMELSVSPGAAGVRYQFGEGACVGRQITARGEDVVADQRGAGHQESGGTHDHDDRDDPSGY